MKASQNKAIQIPQFYISEHFWKRQINCTELIADWTADDLHRSAAAKHALPERSV